MEALMLNGTGYLGIESLYGSTDTQWHWLPWYRVYMEALILNGSGYIGIEYMYGSTDAQWHWLP